MSIRKLNEFFGYALFIVGVLKILLVILVVIQMGTNITAIFNGESVNSEYYPTLSMTIGFAQLILAIGSIIMIILNKKKQPEVITGYLLGLGALLIEFITPSIMSFFVVFVECSMYMKAGTKVKNQNLGSDKNYRKIKQNIKNTEWFYSEKNKGKEQIDSQNKYDVVKEVYESEKTVDLNESDEEENFIKANFVTILLIILILIILFVVGLYIYRITSDFDNNNVNIVETPESMPIINNDINIFQEEQKDNEETIESIVVEEKDIQDSTLSKIANIFNRCNASHEMRLQGYTMSASTTDNKITVFSSGDGLYFNVEFILDNNVLYTEVLYNEADPRITAIEVTLAVMLVDCVGQFKGYPEKMLSTVLLDKVAPNYTIESEGVEIRNLDNSNNIVVKVDLNSDFSFLNTD